MLLVYYIAPLFQKPWMQKRRLFFWVFNFSPSSRLNFLCHITVLKEIDENIILLQFWNFTKVIFEMLKKVFFLFFQPNRVAEKFQFKKFQLLLTKSSSASVFCCNKWSRVGVKNFIIVSLSVKKKEWKFFKNAATGRKRCNFLRYYWTKLTPLVLRSL